MSLQEALNVDSVGITQHMLGCACCLQLSDELQGLWRHSQGCSLGLNGCLRDAQSMQLSGSH